MQPAAKNTAATIIANPTNRLTGGDGTIRRFEIIRGLVALAEEGHLDTPDVADAIARTLHDNGIAGLNADGAAIFARRCDTYRHTAVPATVHHDGTLTLNFTVEG